MKLKDLPLRDWIALEAVPGVLAAGHIKPVDATDRAYDIADAMLVKIDAYQCRIADAERRAREAQTELEVVRGYKFDTPDFSAKIALTQLWDALGVRDQTAAMQKLRELTGGEG